MKPRPDNGSYVEVGIEAITGDMFQVESWPDRHDIVTLVRLSDGAQFWISAQGDVPLSVTTNDEDD